MKEQNFFTTGELSNLAGISKQLLIFYDKKRVFPSTSTGTNGYRHYLLSQYFHLRALISLRKFGISLDEIRKYFLDCNENALRAIYEKKLHDYQLTIDVLKKKSAILQDRINQMSDQKNIPWGQVLIIQLNQKQQFYCWPVDMKLPIKDRVRQIAQALRPYLKKETCLTDNIQGYSLCSDDLFSIQNSPTYSFLTDYIPGLTDKDLPPHYLFSMPEGIYLQIYGYGHYGIISPKTRSILSNFIRINHLVIANHFFVFPTAQCWMTTSKIWTMKIMIQIKNEK